MIKTDKVIYRTRTQEEYDWLMQELEKAGCRWMDGTKPSKLAIFYIHISNTYIYIKDKNSHMGGMIIIGYTIIAKNASKCQI